MPTGTIMPPWQEGYMYEGARYDDDALNRIIDYLREQHGEEQEVQRPPRQAPSCGEPHGGVDQLPSTAK